MSLTLYNRLENIDVRIGGRNVIMEIDESKFGKRKYNRGHTVHVFFVVGMVERSNEKILF